ncbi:hypothetical protein [Acuticoccus yangtzensis]|uniref:hypothetical protein n=1 Tax=Acuticoccus yangtzensis TaxID=1443441 RepID=UPI001300A300|nr:hypothetical protein [Acuticoccus yangtzensis]
MRLPDSRCPPPIAGGTYWSVIPSRADARHTLARDHHMFANRVSEIIKVLAAAE